MTSTPGVRSPGRPLPAPDTGPVDTARDWIVTGVILVLAFVSRFWGLASATDKGTPVFDEKHYAPQSYDIARLGIEENPAYGLVVHPPVAKQIQSLGGLLFDYTPMGWRFTAALAGVLVVLMVMRITRRLTRSTQLGFVAGLLLCLDGVTFVTSRIGMLDIYQVLFVVAAAGALLVDRDQMRGRMHRAALEGRLHLSELGPRLGFRWWRFTAGVMLGLALGVKWSGLYFIAFFGLMTVAWDWALRSRYGVHRPLAGALLRDAVPAFLTLVIWPATLHLFTWLPWFAGENSVYRHAVPEKVADTWLPDALQSWLYYQSSVLDFHSSLTTSAGNRHPWESKPWTWPMSLRPMLYYVEQGEGVVGCGETTCVRAIMLIGTPAIWWLAIPVLAWAFWRAVVSRDGRYAFPLVGYMAGYLPWFFQHDRQMYFFYASVMVPFFVMLIALVLGEIAGSATDSRRRQLIGRGIVSVYLALVIVNFIYMLPILAGLPITQTEWNHQLWLPSWR
ncbi:phospholipid carrier-dependent glycosyltransferase [Dietzia cinnamea]|uniref:dolichyl-phosphate-mannose--protein mannosyltransferase n=1 Tax=Dietzia TaxID=37914 RepID=UPI0007851F6B|nr:MULTISPECIES: phospholipid carrier-dependent glycosyltransferase [Dietzia]KZO60030.1 dolichyl-phosphate-mannose--protein mannosyltransferase [Dietzia maris]MCT1884423.1 phospholipid carrier-dependent glycosyltransferase [Dietzia cinnamea]MCT2098452.1 phospholipid carrier-dependent glycosyltransferase [Dietzia cinnamea]